MMPAANLSNMDYWQKYGEYVLMAMPYADQVLVEGRGCILRDASGQELLDLASGMFCCVLGHNHPKFIQRIVQQTEQLLHTGTQFLSPAVLEAGRKLAEVTPARLQKSIFLSTGTEANEFAFRLAKAYTGRTGIVGFSRGYYGTSLATKSCSSLFSHHLHDSLPSVPESFRLPITPQCTTCFTSATQPCCDFPCLQSLESWIGDWSNIAAVIVEPLLSAGGMLVPPRGYLKLLKELAQDHGTLLIVDEAQTGFGRTGKWFAIEHHDVDPDILSLSKSVGNGFPVAAVITTADIADKVVGDGLWNLSSHQSDPVGAAAIAAVIDIVKEENLVERARESGDYFMNRLRELSARQPLIKNIRGQGLMIGFDLAPTDPDAGAEAANDFMYGCRRRGVHLTYGYGNVNFRIIPPLVITQTEIDMALKAIEASLEEIASQKVPRKQDRPMNPYTRRLLEQHPVRRVVNHWWRSSPEEWVKKGKEIVRRQLGAR
ncbi:MAG TPA: aspartate aminotransferase family protein [Bryobacteraceae bacterium]|nr:aspartate aminotransferase family protein [Bryobacteraceae bacterium]HXJ38468.1 aspartate aminotransferase family protein [Bryobacteraceae bacterium]